MRRRTVWEHISHTEPLKKPKLKRDWVGRKVKLLREVETKGGHIFPVGHVLTVSRNYGGLHLRDTDICKHCGRGERWFVRNVPEDHVELLPEEEGS